MNNLLDRILKKIPIKFSSNLSGNELILFYTYVFIHSEKEARDGVNVKRDNLSPSNDSSWYFINSSNCNQNEVVATKLRVFDKFTISELKEQFICRNLRSKENGKLCYRIVEVKDKEIQSKLAILKGFSLIHNFEDSTQNYDQTFQTLIDQTLKKQESFSTIKDNTSKQQQRNEIFNFNRNASDQNIIDVEQEDNAKLKYPLSVPPINTEIKKNINFNKSNQIFLNNNQSNTNQNTKSTNNNYSNSHITSAINSNISCNYYNQASNNNNNFKNQASNNNNNNNNNSINFNKQYSEYKNIINNNNSNNNNNKNMIISNNNHNNSKDTEEFKKQIEDLKFELQKSENENASLNEVKFQLTLLMEDQGQQISDLRKEKSAAIKKINKKWKKKNEKLRSAFIRRRQLSKELQKIFNLRIQFEKAKLLASNEKFKSSSSSSSSYLTKIKKHQNQIFDESTIPSHSPELQQNNLSLTNNFENPIKIIKEQNLNYLQKIKGKEKNQMTSGGENSVDKFLYQKQVNQSNTENPISVQEALQILQKELISLYQYSQKQGQQQVNISALDTPANFTNANPIIHQSPLNKQIIQEESSVTHEWESKKNSNLFFHQNSILNEQVNQQGSFQAQDAKISVQNQNGQLEDGLVQNKNFYNPFASSNQNPPEQDDENKNILQNQFDKFENQTLNLFAKTSTSEEDLQSYAYQIDKMYLNDKSEISNDPIKDNKNEKFPQLPEQNDKISNVCDNPPKYLTPIQKEAIEQNKLITPMKETQLVEMNTGIAKNVVNSNIKKDNNYDTRATEQICQNLSLLAKSTQSKDIQNTEEQNTLDILRQLKEIKEKIDRQQTKIEEEEQENSKQC